MNQRHGFTLVEMLLVTVILAVLAALIFAALGPAREQSRQAVCISNLKQIRQALAMYQADYDGRDASEGTPSTYTDLGLPVLPLLNVFFDTYVKDRRVLYCPDFVNPEPTGHPITGYKVVFGPEDLFPGSNRFSEVVARQGQNTALMVCDSHSPNFDLSQEPRWTQKRLIIMRLGGHVTNRMYPVRQVYPYE